MNYLLGGLRERDFSFLLCLQFDTIVDQMVVSKQFQGCRSCAVLRESKWGLMFGVIFSVIFP